MSGIRKFKAHDDALFTSRLAVYVQRVDACLEKALPPADLPPEHLHAAMRYATLSGGKRLRPMLVYATGECLDIDPARLDVPATAIELIHAFSLVHDDLPAMDNDDLRRGEPTVHRKFDEATAILAADALQPLAFQTIATSAELTASEITQLVALLAEACGSLGMTGGQAIDLAAEGKALSVDELARMHGLKTGALIRASVLSACHIAHELPQEKWNAMDEFARNVGLAFQIRDDILDVSGQTAVIGKPAGSDQKLQKATWPALFGLDESQRQCGALLESAITALTIFGDDAEPMRLLANYVVERSR